MDQELDYFWTLVGYFNAIRELAQASNLYREDIPSRMKEPARLEYFRDLGMDALELSSNKHSSEIPGILEQLERRSSDVDAAFVTSMFGTGVDIDRLSLMVVHGQPKSTSNYIQATGRVGRKKGALVVTFLRSTRPRDLDHYELFTGYHRAIYRYVEPVSVFPFSPRAYDRGLGPVAVAILRNGTYVNGIRINPDWAREEESWKSKVGKSGSRLMAKRRFDKEIDAITQAIEMRAQNQPDSRKCAPSVIENHLNSEFERWENMAKSEQDLFYCESSFNKDPKHPVVLGDIHHKRRVFESTPQSMREVEPTTRFAGR